MSFTQELKLTRVYAILPCSYLGAKGLRAPSCSLLLPLIFHEYPTKVTIHLHLFVFLVLFSHCLPLRSAF